jgi:hypothetical protein
MFHGLSVSAIATVFALLAVPSVSTADVHPPEQTQPSLEEQAVERARDGADDRGMALRLSGTKSEGAEAGESVDCFYDANKYSAECGGKRN